MYASAFARWGRKERRKELNVMLAELERSGRLMDGKEGIDNDNFIIRPLLYYFFKMSEPFEVFSIGLFLSIFLVRRFTQTCDL